MRTHSGVLAIHFIVLMALPFFTAQADWTADGTSICTAWLHQVHPASAPDASGGAIIAWEDYQGTGDIYAQRIDRLGRPLWTAEGVPICTAPYIQNALRIIPDGSGGAIMVWADARAAGSQDIYAQRVDGSGSTLWTGNGVAICAASSSQAQPAITLDGVGGAIITWTDYRSARWNIYAQRVNASGTTLWTNHGVIICNAPDDKLLPAIVSDNAGGAIITWMDGRNGVDSDIYAQRVNASGATLWTSQGVPVSLSSDDQSGQVITSDGSNGAIIAWTDRRFGTYDIVAQKLDGNGNALWVANGVDVCWIAGAQCRPAIAPDGFGGAIVAWDDDRDSYGDVYAQRINASGNPIWTLDGVLVCGAFSDQLFPMIVPAEAAGAIVCWVDARNGSDNNIYGQRLDGSGAVIWGVNGIPVCSAANTQQNITLTATESGAVIVAWEDYRSGYSDIYAQRLETDYGYWGNPEPVIASIADVPEDQGGFVAIDWEASGRDIHHGQLITGYSIWRATTPVGAMPVGATPVGAMPPGASRKTNLSEIGPKFQGPAYRLQATSAGDYFWEWVGYQTAHYFAGYSFTTATRHDSTAIDPGRHYFQVVAHTDDPYVFWPSDPDSGYSVDNLAPGAPRRLTGEREDPNVLLSWQPSMLHDEDLKQYQVYRDVESGFEPSPETFIGLAVDTTFVDYDPEYELTSYYLVTGMDIHGNEGDPSNELDIPPSSSVPENPSAFGFTARIPNPFAPPARFLYQLPGESGPERAVIRIYDQTGRCVQTLVDRDSSPGRHEVAWDGADARGSAVASGVYLLRLEWGRRTATETVVLVR